MILCSVAICLYLEGLHWPTLNPTAATHRSFSLLLSWLTLWSFLRVTGEFAPDCTISHPSRVPHYASDYMHSSNLFSTANKPSSPLLQQAQPASCYWLAKCSWSDLSTVTYLSSGCMYVRVRFARQSSGRQDDTRRCFRGGELKLKHHSTF